MMVECQRCGRCCRVWLEANSSCSHWLFEITREDVARWKKEGRDDILARVSVSTDAAGEVVMAQFLVDPDDDQADQCPFLQEEGALFLCGNHATKPAMCARFSCVERQWAAGMAYQLTVQEEA